MLRCTGPRTSSIRLPSASRNVRVAATAQREVMKHKLPGESLNLEIVRLNGDKNGSKPPLVFVHGSYHAAWCYEEKFLPYFCSLGYDCYAISMRGQGGSDRPPGASVAGTMAQHAQDLASFTSTLPRLPVVVSHSFGGLIAQVFALNHNSAGLVFLNSVPPTGNGPMVTRFLFRDPILSFKITKTFVAMDFKTDAKACRAAFFSDQLPEAELRKYQQALAQCSPVRMVDLRALSKEVPLPAPPKDHPPALVIGGTKDTVVDEKAVEELAQYYGSEPVVIPGLPHDSMLDVQWKDVADRIEGFLKSKVM